MAEFRAAVQKGWDRLIPTSARPPVMKSGQVTIRLALMKDGSVRDMKLVQSSGDTELDRAAWGAIMLASPFPALPAAYTKESMQLRLNFLYNPGPDDKAKAGLPDAKK